MNVKIPRKWWISTVVSLGLLVLVWTVGTALAEDAGTGSLLAPAGGSPTETFSYQGYLEENGRPANGVYDFRFSVHDQEVGGNQYGITVELDDHITVTHGVFTTYLLPDDPTAIFTGGPRWLQVEVRPGTSTGAYTTLARQPIAPSPYAWGLRPGARITGDLASPSAVISVTQTSGASDAFGVYAHAQNVGVYGSATDPVDGAGVRGFGNKRGVHGRSGAIGVHGEGTGSGSTGVKGEAADGTGVWGTSTNGTAVYGNTSASGGIAAHFHNLSTGVALRVESETTVNDVLQVYGSNGADIEFSVEGDGDVFADGAYHCASSGSEPGTCIVQGAGADFAEMLPAHQGLEPGDVLIIDADGRLARSTEAHQPSVVGVYSTRPGYLGGGDHLGEEGYAPVALVGIVPVKASAENGPILPGDLLTSSSTPGHAMKADPNPSLGTVVGKALQPLAGGTGIIQMLVMLQ